VANICEVCGKTEGEETTGEQLMMETLHICEQCRQDRQSVEVESPSEQA